MLRFSNWLWPLLLLPTIVPFARAENALNIPNQTLGQVLRSSGYIFAGTVTSIQRTSAGEAAVDSVQITFRVDRAIRGVRRGQSLTIREWSGLWTSGEHYLPGQRVMLFLYRPSKLGLTSSVGGPLGRLDVDQDGRVLLQPEWQAGPSKSPVLQPKKNRLSVREFARALRRPAEE